MTAANDTFFEQMMDTLILWLGFPGLKKIAWHLSKKFKDVLNGVPGDTGPSKEERLAQRQRDVLTGFAYFDTFQELEDWLPEHVDPIQRANTPLLQRPALTAQKDNVSKTSKIILCHDYNGGYHDYESVRPAGVDTEYYSCEYLQYVDTFIYFSHKLVCVPPPTWINTLHRNGVKVLGTFMIEPHSPDVHRILRETDGDFHVAKQLACMADTFGFDGWLLNIEKEFPEDTTHFSAGLTNFIENLKKHAGGDKQVIWYDALTINNKVEYQNGLTERNLAFALAAEALFTNYEWTASNVIEARRIARENAIDTESIFFGIDVWAQNTNMSGPPRITYPPEGGGGTNTGVAINALANLNFSTAIFAPGWTFEHFSDKTGGSGNAPPPGRLVEQSMWEGAKLPGDIQCNCKKGISQHTMEFKNHPIVQHGREYAAGSSTYFETNFNRAFEIQRPDTTRPHDGHYTIPQLGAQSILPHLLPMPRKAWEKLSEGPPTQVIYGELASNLDSGLVIYAKVSGEANETSDPVTQQPAQAPESHRLCLFSLDMPTDTSLTAHVTYHRPRSSRSIKTGFYLAYRTPGHPSLSYTYHDALDHSTDPSRSLTQQLPIIHHHQHQSRQEPVPHLVELGIYTATLFRHHPSPPLPLLTLHTISILPKTYNPPAYTITNLRLTTRGTLPYTQKRLVWDFHSPSPEKDTRDSRMPWSKTTGPFSHFVVQVGGVEIGRAWACEFPLKREDLEGKGEDGVVEVRVEGVMFGCGKVTGEVVRIEVGGFVEEYRKDDGWIEVGGFVEEYDGKNEG